MFIELQIRTNEISFAFLYEKRKHCLLKEHIIFSGLHSSFHTKKISFVINKHKLEAHAFWQKFQLKEKTKFSCLKFLSPG